jgi:hypothetical protein
VVWSLSESALVRQRLGLGEVSQEAEEGEAGRDEGK